MVIKADQFRTWHEKHIDKDEGVITALAGLANLRSRETVEQWGRLLGRLHRPSDPLQLPEFMTPGEVPPSRVAAATREAVAGPSEVDAESLKRKLICAKCGKKISFAEGKFCWNNERRFGGLQYCRDDQAAFR